MKILVTYATRAGSTAGVAQAIGETLSTQGLEVEVCPVTDVTDLTAYQAVVIGSAIRDRQWLPEARRFVEQHRAALAHKPCAMFVVCLTMTMRQGKYQPGVAEWMEPVRKLIKPVSEGYFAGALDFSKLPLTFNTLLMRGAATVGIWKIGDHRDWEAIRSWASALPEKFQPEKSLV